MTGRAACTSRRTLVPSPFVMKKKLGLLRRVFRAEGMKNCTFIVLRRIFSILVGSCWCPLENGLVGVGIGCRVWKWFRVNGSRGNLPTIVRYIV